MPFKLLRNNIPLRIIQFIHADAFNVFRHEHDGLIVLEAGINFWDWDVRIMVKVLQCCRLIEESLVA
jgi:hypothetical protein